MSKLKDEFDWQKFHNDLDWVLAEYLINKPSGSIYDEIIELATYSNHSRLLQNKPRPVDAQPDPQRGGDSDV